MENLKKYLCNLPLEKVWMYFFAHGCEECPAKKFCDEYPELCCPKSFKTWAMSSAEETPDRGARQ